MAQSFAKLITEASLEELAGERSFARGVAYFENGAVVDLVQTRNAIKARVLGGEEYRVALHPERRRLEWSCTCPLGEEGAFCKHAVAAGLAWLARHSANGPISGSEGGELGGVEDYLRAQTKEALVALLLEQASDDPDLRARLQAAALRDDPPTELKALKEAMRRALAVSGGFVDRRAMRAFVTRADSAAALLRDLLAKDRAFDAVTLADYAMRRGIVAYQKCDDSGGEFGDTLREIARLHLDACRRAKPEPEALGAQLFELQKLDEWGFFEFGQYAPLLRKEGIARYRALAEKAWADVPARKPRDSREPDTERFIITHIMERLARHDGDTDALVALKSRDLSHSHTFLEIAQLFAQAGRRGEALAWAERGRKSFPDDFNGPLVQFLVDGYHRQGCHAERRMAVLQPASRSPADIRSSWRSSSTKATPAPPSPKRKRAAAGPSYG